MKDKRLFQMFRQNHADTRPPPKANTVEVRQPGQIKVNRLNKSISGERVSAAKATSTLGSTENGNTFSAQQVELAVMKPVEKTATKSKRRRKKKTSNGDVV